MKDRKRPVYRFLVLLMTVVLFAQASFAADGSETLTIYYQYNGVQFSVYLAETQKEGVWTPTGLFENYSNITWEDSRKAAIALEEIVKRDGLKPDGVGVVAGGSAKIAIPAFTEGKYLVVGEPITVDGTVWSAVPVLVELSGSDLAILAKKDAGGEISPGGSEPSTEPASPDNPAFPDDPSSPGGAVDPSEGTATDDTSGTNTSNSSHHHNSGGGSGSHSSGIYAGSSVNSGPGVAAAGESGLSGSPEGTLWQIEGVATGSSADPGSLAKTGDSSFTTLWLVLLLISACGLELLFVIRRRTRQSEEGRQ